MSGLLLAVILALVTGIAIMLAARLSIRTAAPVATALLLGLAGYAWQGSPGLAGKPVAAAAPTVGEESPLVAKRKQLGERMSGATKWQLMSDSFASRGETADAANVLLAGLRENPENPDLWTGLGNALMAHGKGIMSPAAEHAFRRALAIEPRGKAANYFYGLALAESGEFERARGIWIGYAAGLAVDDPLRAELARNAALLELLIRRREAAAGGAPAPPPGGGEAP